MYRAEKHSSQYQRQGEREGRRGRGGGGGAVEFDELETAKRLVISSMKKLSVRQTLEFVDFLGEIAVQYNHVQVVNPQRKQQQKRPATAPAMEIEIIPLSTTTSPSSDPEVGTHVELSPLRLDYVCQEEKSQHTVHRSDLNDLIS